MKFEEKNEYFGAHLLVKYLCYNKFIKNNLDTDGRN